MTAEALLEKVPPQSIEAEMAVLGSMLFDNDVAGEVFQIIGEESFYKSEHQKICRVMVELFDTSKPIDTVTLAEGLQQNGHLDDIGGPLYLAALIDSVPTAANAEHYANIVRDKGLARQLIHVTTEIVREAYDASMDARELLDRAEGEIYKIAGSNETSSAAALRDILAPLMGQIENIKDGALIGVPTGFSELDSLLCGLQESQLIVLAGRPSMGKTSLALNMCEHVGLEKKLPVLFFTLEMSKQQLAQNMLCSHARVNAHQLRHGIISKQQFSDLGLAVGSLSEAPIFIDDSPGLTLMGLRAKARRFRSQHNIQLVVLDYLQLLSSGTRTLSREQEVSFLSRSLKGLSRELRVPVLALSQLSRAPEKENRKPRMSDLRESGAIEQDADVVLLLHRDDYYQAESENKGIADLIIAKQRSGPTDTIKLHFKREYMRFGSHSAREQDDTVPF